MTDTTKERAQFEAWMEAHPWPISVDGTGEYTSKTTLLAWKAWMARAEKSTETPPRIQRFWDAQAEWSQATFGTDAERDHIGPLKHLEKEAVEAQTRPADYVEIADCLFLVFDAARRSGMTLEMLIEIADKKLVVNKARKWSKPTSDAPVEHVRVAEAPRPVGTPEECPTCESDLQEARNFGNHTVSGWLAVLLFDFYSDGFDGPKTCSDPWHDGPVGTPE